MRQQQRQQAPSFSIPSGSQSAAFGLPYRSGAGLQFDRTAPWYIVEAMQPVERPVTRWGAINHRLQEAQATEARTCPEPMLGRTSTSQITDGEGRRVGLSVARVFKEGSTDRLTQAALGKHAAAFSTTEAGHKLGQQYVASSIGSGASEDSEAEPGPGHYNIPSKIIEGPAFSMGGKNVRSAWLRRAEDAEPVPGPGQYHSGVEAVHAHSGPAYTIGARPKEIEPEESSPGPGYYQKEVTGSPSGPAFTMAGPRLEAPEAKFPGPGDYCVHRVFDPDALEGPAYTLAGRPRPRSPAGRDGPGPSEYQNPLVPVGGGPAFTMAQRPKERKAEPAPGPGDLERPSEFGRAGQAYTFGSRAAEKSPKDKLPGPGEYSVPRGFDVHEGPAYTMGQQLSAVSKEPNDAPGPGEYDAQGAHAHREAGPAFTIQGRTPAPKKKDKTPGPGAYGHRNAMGTEGAAYTMGQRAEERGQASDLPGPGAYTTAGDFAADGPAFTMPGRHEGTDGGEDVPGPGDYVVEFPSDGPAFTMGGRIASPTGGPDQAGPSVGQYNLREAWKEGPAITIGSRQRERGAPSAPGPGEYDVRRSQTDGPAFTLGERLEGAEDAIRRANVGAPGPGNYEPKAPGEGGPAFSLGGRYADPGATDAADAPGPGRYQPKFIRLGDDGPSYTIGEHIRAPADNDRLGPGHYNVEQAARDGPAYTIGEKIQAAADPAGDDPGPGMYQVPSGQAGPAFTIGAKIREIKATSKLGPGEYIGQKALVGTEGPSYTIGERLPEAEPDIQAGPGHYQLPEEPTGPKITMATSKRPGVVDAEHLDMPGPGAYAPKGPKEDGPKYSMALKLTTSMPDEDIPGPATYRVPEGPSGPKYSITGKAATTQEDRDAMEKPGPGAYKLPDRTGEGPKVTIGTKLQPIQEDPLPGPGAYRIKQSEDGPKITIAQRMEHPEVNQARREAIDMPAPGDYGMPGLDKPSYKFYMGERLKEAKPQDVPAPGDYHGLNAAPNRPDGPKFTMGGKLVRKRIRRGKGRDKGKAIAIEDDTPGPSDYASHLTAQGPKYSLGMPTKSPPPADTPAPGDYAVHHHQSSEGARYTLRGKLDHGSPWAQALRNAREGTPGPGDYNEAKPFPRPLGKVVTSLMKARVAASD